MDVFRVIEPGPLTTVQDQGRYGYQQYGVPLSGSLDDFSSVAANLLVGNPATAAVLEMTFRGPSLEVISEAQVAVAGAEMIIRLNDESRPNWAAFRVRPGDRLRLKAAAKGLRAYLAVSGGIDVPEIMGSRSTYVAAKLGGHEGRALVKGDVLRRGQGESPVQERRLPKEMIPDFGREVLLRAMPGPQDHFFEEGLRVFFGSEFKVSTKADRMGYRLEGPPVLLRNGAPQSIISEPSLPGGVQIPADNQPIILLKEQTVGGYAKIATVVSPDLNRVAQARPGDKVRFQEVDIATARKIHLQARQKLQQIKESLLT
ncbi:MAG: biotin-dependent carboxyltransferase family protein [Deltaproteobacteria bacterium]|nr:biotin-dependent carboxyltransferase family protein [Deltaproteobacteria bacterium]